MIFIKKSNIMNRHTIIMIDILVEKYWWWVGRLESSTMYIITFKTNDNFTVTIKKIEQFQIFRNHILVKNFQNKDYFENLQKRVKFWIIDQNFMFIVVLKFQRYSFLILHVKLTREGPQVLRAVLTRMHTSL